jgi:GGDEF domain-containing protein
VNKLPYERFRRLVLFLGTASFSSFATFAFLKGNYLYVAVDVFIFLIVVAALYGGRQLAWVSFFLFAGLHSLVQFIVYPLFTSQNLNLFLQNIVLYAIVAFACGELFTWLKYKLPEIEHLELIDAETGIWNATEIRELLHKEMEKERRYGTRFSLVELNLKSRDKDKVKRDFFKNLGNILTRNIRLADEPGRIAENKFLIIFPHTTSQGAEVAASRLTKLIEDIIPFENDKPLFEVSFKVVPTDHETLMKYIEVEGENE